jgi:argininosuccinate lyase
MQKNKLWETLDNTLHPLVESFTVGNDYKTDLGLLPYDIQASIAHAQMLFEIKILTKTELLQAEKGLNEILEKCKRKEFIITKNQEDGHTAIEQYLTEKYGEIGKKIHTGRSRNDQSLVMIRLFMKEKLLQIKNKINKLILEFESQSNKNKESIMPGYTHMQKAMPTTVGKYFNYFSESLKDFIYSLESTIKIIDQNPLGSASGFGIENFPIDKKFTTKKLNFKKVQTNPLYCSFSRGYFENIVLQTLSQPMIIASKFANDMLLFTTQEFDFFYLPKEFTTGSSIMPQKRNYDIFEIMRGNIKIFDSYQTSIQDIIISIGSGYQRDLQLTKKPFIKGINLCIDTIIILSEIIKNIKVKNNNLEKAMTDDLYKTNDVYKLVNNGISFRDAYIKVKNNL